MKLRFSRRQARIDWPVLEAFRTSARQSLGDDAHEVVSFTIHYQALGNGSLQKDLGEDPGDDFSETIGRADQSQA